IWIIISFATFFGVFVFFDHLVWFRTAYPIYIGTIISLVAVLLFGVEIKGATSWFRMGGFTIQPSEITKFGTCLAMAAYLNSWSNRMDDLRSIGVGFGIWVLPMLLILLQPDAGSALVFTSFLLVMYREGLSSVFYLLGGFVAFTFILGILYPPAYLALGLIGAILLVYSYYLPNKKLFNILMVTALLAVAIWAVLAGYKLYVYIALPSILLTISAYLYLRRRNRLVNVALASLAIGVMVFFASNYFFNNVLKPHQQERINVWLQPGEANPRGPLYNITQSKLAIAAGGLDGKGLTKGTMTRFGYVPEQKTDFIFCVVGEEHGFVGSMGVILLYLILLWRISILAERQRSTFNRAYAYGVAGIIFIHVLVNIGMTMGLVPVIGIPLPFLSKGGSSLLGFSIMLAVLLKLDKLRDEA
ncbi:MAG: rod shape-determining protein RodA, partial [Bacteroidota bacterium]